jgi:hypothetical protein
VSAVNSSLSLIDSAAEGRAVFTGVTYSVR